MDRRSRWMEKFVFGFIGFVFLFTILGAMLQLTIAWKVIKEIDDNGLKSVVERVWEGKNG